MENRAIGPRLKYFRINVLGIKKQREMSDALGISQPAYSRYERGERTIPQSVLQLLREKYDLNIDWLLLGYGNCLTSYSDEEILTALSKVSNRDKRTLMKVINCFIQSN